jgi:hypothetical protein
MKDPLLDLSEELRKKLTKEITAIPLKRMPFVFPPFTTYAGSTRFE